ncbi:hypothetical protein [Nocardia cyriacigeorgica]|uniref:hypothetical protein n=1 Tax=Nocardia cyriacigeorgica TaxID=135487 RepID=UPI0018953093|nr:hypothetical protein [Nocardia cyriacigeorgica]MBF6416966.1 hypothetical protein [Nocardia cyriacigeorgica]
MPPPEPAEHGVYRDVQGDLWIHDELGWRHAARRLTDGTLSVVLDRFVGPISYERLVSGPWDPGVAVLPFERVEVGEIPPELRPD